VNSGKRTSHCKTSHFPFVSRITHIFKYRISGVDILNRNFLKTKRLFSLLNGIAERTRVIILSLPLEEIKITNQRLQQMIIRITIAGYPKRLFFLLMFYIFHFPFFIPYKRLFFLLKLNSTTTQPRFIISCFIYNS